MDLREAIRSWKMKPLQVGVVTLCIALAALDGYEVLVMALVAPTLAAAWGLDGVALGYLLSAGLFGMAAGAIFLSPISDRIGRRQHIIACLFLGALGMVLSGMATSVPALIAARAFAGLWIGAILPSINVIANEFSSDRRRGTVLGVYGVGLPLGGVLGGLITGWLIANWGWPGPFVFSGLLSAVLGIIAIIYMPESPEFLIERRPKGALEAYNRIARRLRYDLVEELPAPKDEASGSRGLKEVFSGTLMRRTLLLWGGFGLLTASFYFAFSWTTTMISNATGDPSVGRSSAILMMLGGIGGALVFAACSMKWKPRVVAVAMLVSGLPVYLVFAAFYKTSFVGLLAILVGLVTSGSIAAIYAISPHIYPAANRAAAVGFMMGFGRGVSIVVPILIGYLLKAAWTPEQVYQVFGVVMLLAGLCVLGLHRTYRGRTEDPELVHNEDTRDVVGVN